MLFTDYRYLAFLLAAFCLYYLAERLFRGRGGARAQNLVLLGLGYGFYAFWDWRWLFLLAGVTLTGYGGALLLARFRSRKTLVLALVIVADLVALGFFKYFEFFADSLARLFGRTGRLGDLERDPTGGSELLRLSKSILCSRCLPG